MKDEPLPTEGSVEQLELAPEDRSEATDPPGAATIRPAARVSEHRLACAVRVVPALADEPLCYVEETV